ncbi:RNA-directed DNA polymerase, eukaryota, Reverse transcriptase zinc-binding domain protein [Artemisia annua]|uniref:RNA-directed DNA polymerase, eukaryota, Reverse transcriptase zinc-binding domain protein n=1 Tax=Artemisia annua TaxID=35608 RepID=A0A2U1LBS0_ARTAN|nr:RNA-directed DNA polymerase, eukaryota, Reverse transcriptase zinc-binding domain protein [Artemisia annua]
MGEWSRDNAKNLSRILTCFQLASGLKIKDDLLNININLNTLFKIKLGNGRSTSFWNDIWIGDTPLIASFPRLYHLDRNPDCLVCDRNPTAQVSLIGMQSAHLTDIVPMSPYFPPGLIFQWAWRREPRSGPETEELITLVSLLSNLYLSDVEDRWECIIDASRCFSVKGMRSFISSMPQSVSASPTRWNKVVPLKININTWRVLNGRMATRANLDRRGVDLDSVRCPICDDAIETEEHLFVDCKIARHTWINTYISNKIECPIKMNERAIFPSTDDF